MACILNSVYIADERVITLCGFPHTVEPILKDHTIGHKKWSLKVAMSGLW